MKLNIIKLCVVFLFTLTVFVYAGDLEPTAAPGSTMKTLSDIEPRVAINSTNTPATTGYAFAITEGGSYYLSGNVSLGSNTGGIVIAADNVTIDLCGFEISNDFESISYSGIYGYGRKNITIRNGTIKGFNRGVYFYSSTGTADIMCCDLTVTNNNLDGISIAGTSTGAYTGGGNIIQNCIAESNGDTGFVFTFGTVIENCIAKNNSYSGFSTGYLSTVKNCTAINNVSRGFSIGTGSCIENSTCKGSTTEGIYATAGCTVKGCTVYDCGSEGIQASGNCVVENNVVYQCDSYGIDAGAGCVIKANALRQNGVYAINASEGCVIKDNSMYGNNGSGGIYANIGCTIIGNSCMYNGAYGIYCIGSCVISHNTCYGHNTANIYAPASCVTDTNFPE